MNASLGKTEFTESEIADLQSRVMALKASRTWKEVGQLVGVPEGTISSWAPGKYQGKDGNIAAIVHRYFLSASERDELAAVLPTVPDYVPTPSSRRFITCLRMAHMGDMAAVAAAPGVGKTAALTQYQATNPKVVIVTISPAHSSMPNMLAEILKAMGETAKGMPQHLSSLLRKKVSGGGWLIALDEAQFLNANALEELRSIHDATNTGIALFGDERLISRLKPYPQFFSRLGTKYSLAKPLAEDVTMVAAAWGVDRGPELQFCQDIGRRPGALRALTKALRNATFAARQDGTPMHLSHLKEAWSMNGMDEAA